MYRQTEMTELTSYKIVIEGVVEELQRISTFLDNNYIRHSVIDQESASTPLKEFEDYLEWPLNENSI